MKRTKISFSTVLTGFFTSLLLFFSCEVGLGEAVDTRPPSIVIEKPEVDKVIRDKFLISGTWEDDGTIDNVYVLLKRTDGKPLDGTSLERKVDATFTVDELDDEKGTWQAIVDPLEENNQIIDGSYQATVVITDKGKHSTSQITTFTIDNTAPVLILSKPNSTPEDSTLSAYGQRLFLEGSIADATKDTWVQLDFYSGEECTEERYLTTIETGMISPTDVNSNNARLAIYNTDLTQQYATEYYKLYGKTEKDGAEQVYAKITVYDTAEICPVEGSGENPTSNGKIKGNASQSFYLTKKLAESITKSQTANGYGLAPIDIYNVLNGTYALKNESRAADAKTIKNELSSDEQKKTISVFTINPENSPYFTISGLKTLNKDGKDFEEGNTIVNGTQTIEVSVFMGSDSISLKDDNDFYVYLLECDQYGKPKKEDVEENRIKLYSKYKESGSGSEKKTYYKVGGKTDHKTTSGAYVFSIPMNKSLRADPDKGLDGYVNINIEYGKNYLILVSGKDTEGNTIETTDGGYGFCFTAGGSAPRITITEPADNTIFIKKGDGLKVKGTVVSEGGEPRLTISNDTNLVDLPLTPAATGEGTYTFEKLIPAEEIGFAQNESVIYSLIFSATRDATESTQTKSVWYDVEGPVITMGEPSPLVKANSTKADGTTVTKDSVNGVISLSGSIIDAFDTRFGSASFKVEQNGVQVNKSGLSGDLDKNFDFTIDTRLLTDNKDAVIVISGTDYAGNVNEERYTYFVDQSTDVPKITSTEVDKNISEEADLDFVQGGNNLYQRGGNLVLTISDDDGVASARVKIEEYNNGSYIDPDEGSTEKKQDISYPSPSFISHALPNSVGIYRATVTVYDKHYESEASTQNNFKQIQFFLRVTGTGPDVSITPDKEYINNLAGGKYVLTFNVTNEGNKPYMLKMGTTTVLNDINDDSFTYEITPSTTASIKFTVIDKNSSFTEKNFVPRFDSEAPVVSITNWPNSPSLTEDATYLFKGEMSDTGNSGINKVQIKFVDGTQTSTDDEGWADCTAGSINWNSEITWSANEVFNTEGEKTVFVKAIDGAGNESTVYKTFTYDKSKPVLTVANSLSTSETNIVSDEVGASGYVLSGTVTETNALATSNALVIKVDGQSSTITPNATTGEWSYTITKGTTAGKLKSEASIEVELLAKDIAGKTDNKKYIIYYDTQAPELVVTAPAENEPVSTSSLAIKGTVSDNGYGVENVEYVLYSGNVTSANEASATKIQSDSKDVTSENFPIERKGEQWYIKNSSVNMPLGTTEGALTLKVKATEKTKNGHGGRTTTEYVPFYFDKANPTLTESSISATGKTKNVGFALSGKAIDSNALASVIISWGTNNSVTLTPGEGEANEMNWSQSFVVGSETVETGTYKIADGTNEFTIVAKDITGKEKQMTRTVIVDTTKPDINASSITNSVGATIAGVSWYKNRSLSVEVTAVDANGDNGTGISMVEYSTSSDGGTTWSAWSPLSSFSNNLYKGTVSFGADGQNLKFKVHAIDVAGNESDESTTTVNIDTTAPVLEALYYKKGEGTASTITSPIYIKENTKLTVYGNYKDEESGVNALAYAYGNPAIKYSTEALTGTPVDSNYTLTAVTGSETSIKSWRAEFTPAESGAFTVTGSNRTGDSTNALKVFDVTVDKEAPVVDNVRLIEVNSDKNAYSDGSKYYVNNSAAAGKTFKISGVATDTVGVDSVELLITKNGSTTETKTPTRGGTLGQWYFDGINLSDWTGTGASAKITVKDKAGNETIKTLNIAFDVTAPSADHKIDDSLKNLEFRIGDAANDAGETDVGGKYSDGTYGSALTMQIRGNFPDETNGSGINKFYYKTFNNEEVTIDSSKENGSIANGKIYFKTLDDLKDYVIANKTDVFSPLSTVETKNVEYNVGPFVDDDNKPLTSVADTVLTNDRIRFGGNPTTPKTNGNYTVNSKGYVQFRTEVDTNFKTTIKGFVEGKNYLVIVAEDNAGNAAVDYAVVSGITYPCYSLNVDITAPTIPTKPEGSLFTNLEEEGGVVIAGTVSDMPNVTNGSSGLKKIVFTRDGGTGSVEVTTFTAVTAAERTAAGTAYSSDTTLKHWEANIASLLPPSGMAIISAKVVDNAGFETSTPVATITVDKAGPALKVNSPSATAKVGTSFIISGTADDGNGAGIDTTEGMTLYYTKDQTLGEATTAPESIIAGTDPDSSWIAYTTAPSLTDSDWTVSFTVPDSVAADSENTNVYFTVYAKDLSGTGNVSYVVPRKITVDRVMPEYDTTYTQLSIGGKTHSQMIAAPTPWFKDNTLVVKGQFTDAGGSGVTKIFYQVDSGNVEELATKDGTYNTNISGFGANSTLKLWAEDEVGNNTSENPIEYTIKVDTVVPNLTETGVGTTGKTTSSTVTLKGKAWDTNQLDRIEISDGTKTWKSTDTDSNISLTKRTSDPGEDQTNWSASFVVGSSNNTKANYIADGTKEFTIIAYDIAGQQKQLSRTVVVDTASPTCGTPVITSSKNTVDGKNWYKSSFIDIKLENVTDGTNGTGISKVEYTTDNTNWYSMSGSGTTYTATVNCANQGPNTITVRVSDAAENTTVAGTLTAYVDTKEPSLENSWAKYITDNYEAVSELLINGDNGYELKISAKDVDGGTGTNAANNSGIASVQYSYSNTTSSFTINGTKSGDYWIIPVPKDGNGTNNYSSTGSNKIYVIIKDNAGNEIKERILTVTKDTTPPTVEIKSFTRAGSKTTVSGTELDNVNGTITISGLADDTNRFGSVKLEYKKDGEETWTQIPTTSQTSWTTTLNTKTLTDNKKYTIKATATDAAGNTNEHTQDVYVNQDSDRPVITVTNITLATAANATSYLKRTSRLEGTVSDDDGNVTKLEYSADGTSWTEATLEYGTAWSIADLPEGDNKLYFRVTDAVNTTPFVTAIESESATSEAANQPKIKDNNNTYVSQKQGSLALNFKVVTKQPDVENKKYQVYNSSTNAWENRDSLGTLGGDYTKFKISLDAKSDAYISKVQAKYKTDSYDINFSTTETTTNSSYHTWSTGEIELDATKTEIKLKISDSSSETDPMTLEQTVSYTVDNTAPTIRIKEPSSTAGVKETMQLDLSELATAYYAVTKSDVTTAPTEASKWTLIQDTSNALARYVFFDDDINEIDHTDRFALYLTEPTEEKPNRLGITTVAAIERTTDPYETITQVKFWVKAVDSCGNTATKDQLVNVDPQGNRPTVTLGYPVNVLKDGSYVAPTLGGTIRLDGNVSDDIAAKYVWIKIEREDNAFSVADVKFLSEKHYTIGNMTDNTVVADATIADLDDNADVSNYAIRVPVTGTSWNLSINGSQEFNLQNAEANLKFKIYATDEDPDKVDASIKHIHRSAEISQQIVIDSRTPYISASELRIVKYEGGSEADKEYKEGTSVHGIWYLQGTIKDDDSGIRTISYKKNSDTAYTDAITAAGGEKTNIGGDSHFYFTKVAHTDDANKFDYNFSVPLGNSTTGQVGTDTITLKAVEATGQNLQVEQTYSVTYDNKAPEFITDSENSFVKLSQNVLNSNGFYTFGAIASEDKVSVNGADVAQSGVERIAFYFTRDLDYSLSELPDGSAYNEHTNEKDSKTNDLFDVMIYHSNGDSADVTSGNMIVNYKGKAEGTSATLSYSEGLYWRTHSGSADGKTFTYSENAVDPNIHAGGLVKINGVIYTIESVSGKTVNLPNNIGDASSAQFALCNVIDSGGEKNGSSTSNTHGYGFGYYGTRTTDDGDLITETFNNQGTDWIFDASVNSRNLPDGPITLHMVAFDKAGNVTAPYTITGTVKNNAPRIAGLILGTDENGNGSVDEGEFVNAWSNKFEKGYDTTGNEMHDVVFPVTPAGQTQKSLLTIKGLTVVKPEIIGGNGAISYSYKVGTKDPVDGGALQDSNEDDISGTTDDVVTGVITLPVSAFIGTTNGQDSESIPDGELSLFKFTFGDSTPGTSKTDTTGKNSASMSVILDVALRETTKAKNWILPFYWKSATDNSLFNQSKDNGHIELAADWVTTSSFTGTTGEYDADPKVSGKIKIEGIAQDDTLLRDIKVQFGTSMGGLGTTDTTIASYNAAGGTWTVTPLTNNAISSSTGWASAVQQATYQDLVDVGIITETEIPEDKEPTSKVPYTSQDYGHVVHWILYLDTEKVSGVAATDVTVTATATDRGTPKWSTAVTPNAAAYTTNGAETTVTENNDSFSGKVSADGTVADLTGKYRVDVVPYVTEVKRNSTYNTNKARSGAVSLLRGEATNLVKGFNLGTTTNTSIKIAANKAGTESAVAMTSVALSGTNLSFSVPTTAKTGYLHVVVNSIAALNNMNSYVDYNTETNAKAYDHNTLTDDRYVHVWRVSTADTFKGSKNANYPAMSSDSNGVLYASFTNYGQAKSYYSKAFVDASVVSYETSSTATGDVTTVYFGYDPSEDTDISVGPDGKVNVFYNANYHGGNSTAWNGNAPDDAGGLYVYDPAATSTNYNTNSNQPHKLYRFELYTYDDELNQFKNTRVNRTYIDDTAYVNIAYYDRLSNAIKYSYTDTEVTYTVQNNNTAITFTYNAQRGGFTITNNTNYNGYYVLIDGTYHLLTRAGYQGSRYYLVDGYDSTSNFSAKVYQGTSSAIDTSTNGLSWVTIDGDGDSLDENGTGFTFADDWTPFKLATDRYSGVSQSSATGESVALSSTSAGYPVILYMDATTGQPRIAFANSKTPTTSNNWTVQGVFAEGDDNYDTASDYMSCMVDSNNYLHIAFQNTKGQLVYAKSTNNPTNGTTAYTFGESQVLDDSGMWIDMTMNGDTPYISYLSRVNSYDGMKIAFYDENFDEDNDGDKDGGWETITAAMNAKVTNVRTCIEPNARAADYGTTNTKYTVAIGYHPGSDYRAAFYVGK